MTDFSTVLNEVFGWITLNIVQQPLLSHKTYQNEYEMYRQKYVEYQALGGQI